MKLPRWLFYSMIGLNVLGVIVAAWLCWVTWPERTAHRFVTLISDAKLDDARKMVRPREFVPLILIDPNSPNSDILQIQQIVIQPNCHVLLLAEQFTQEAVGEYFKECTVVLLPRSAKDLFLGRQGFRMSGYRNTYTLVAERAQVYEDSSGEFDDQTSH